VACKKKNAHLQNARNGNHDRTDPQMNKNFRNHTVPALTFLLLACHLLCADTTARTVSVNGGFENGLTAWKTTGDVKLDTNQPLEGKASVRIGPGPGSITQRVALEGNNHIRISATIHSLEPASGMLTVRFLDKDGSEVMSVDSSADMKPGDQPGKISHYMKPHPLTASVEITVSKSSKTGYVEADQVQLGVYEENLPSLQSTLKLADIMKPLWRGNTVTNEALLMVARDGLPAIGTLMFQPTRILSVTDYAGTALYQEGTDFTSEGRALACTPHTRMAQVNDSDLVKGELAWNIVGGKQVMVTYEHSQAWTGPIQPYVGEQMPGTMRKLSAQAPLRIVAFGDSITFGLGSSRMLKIPPFQAPWIELFVDQLQHDSGDSNIALYNSSQSGADSNWAKGMAARMVASLNPDLVVIAFGQNDFWSVSADTFASNISAVIQTVRSKDPGAEFLLVSTMRFDPAYSSNPAYWRAVTEYDLKLRGLTGPSVQLVDFTSISGAVFAAKEPKDCLNDPLHPNDYLSRWYAQSLVAALTLPTGN
jgi:lysophospholipase L1-like esterase